VVLQSPDQAAGALAMRRTKKSAIFIQDHLDVRSFVVSAKPPFKVGDKLAQDIALTLRQNTLVLPKYARIFSIQQVTGGKEDVEQTLASGESGWQVLFGQPWTEEKSVLRHGGFGGARPTKARVLAVLAPGASDCEEGGASSSPSSSAQRAPWALPITSPSLEPAQKGLDHERLAV
jgi:hypothetical protein